MIMHSNISSHSNGLRILTGLGLRDFIGFVNYVYEAKLVKSTVCGSVFSVS